jgi:hypothetical protein
VEVRFYFDYRSPFVYLAKDLVYGIEDHYPPDAVHVRWLPFAFPVEEGFGLPGAPLPPPHVRLSFFSLPLTPWWSPTVVPTHMCGVVFHDAGSRSRYHLNKVKYAYVDARQ